MAPPAEPMMAKVPQGETATLLTSVPSPVSKAHLPARLRPQNHVLAVLSPACPVTILSQPVMLTSGFFLSCPLTLEELFQMPATPGMAPMPPSRLREQAMHVTAGAFRSSNRKSCFERSALPFKRPIFLAFFWMAP